MHIRRAYGFAFQDPAWRSKLARASVLSLASWVVPAVGQMALMGWLALVLRGVIQGHDEGMPELRSGRLTKLLMTGFRPWIVQSVWTFPIVVVVGTIWALRLLLLLVADRTSPVVIVIWIASTVLTVVGGGVMSIFAQAALLRAEVTDDLRAGFDVKAVARFVRVMWWECAKDIVFTTPLNGLIVVIGLVPCGLGLFPALAITSLANAHMRAQLYQEWLDRGGAEWPLAPTDGPRVSLIATPAAPSRAQPGGKQTEPAPISSGSQT